VTTIKALARAIIWKRARSVSPEDETGEGNQNVNINRLLPAAVERSLPEIGDLIA
jgi:hypothetical protein